MIGIGNNCAASWRLFKLPELPAASKNVRVKREEKRQAKQLNNNKVHRGTLAESFTPIGILIRMVDWNPDTSVFLDFDQVDHYFFYDFSIFL